MISIIVPAYNSARTITACLSSIRAQSTDLAFEVVCVDDGSDDETFERALALTRDWPELRVLQHPERRGPGAARNTAIRNSSGELLVLLDADSRATPGWLERLVAPLLDGRAELVGAPDRVPEDDPLVARCIGYSMDSPLASGGLRWGRPQLVSYAPGTGNTGLLRTLFDLTGGMDERFHDTGEDSEWMLRVRPYLTRPALFVPEAVVWHHRITSPVHFFRKMFRCGRRRVDIWRLWPRSLELPHLAPLVLALGLAGLALARPRWLLTLLVLWLGSDALRGVRLLGDRRALLVVPFTSFTVGVAYGLGSLARLTELLMGRAPISDLGRRTPAAD
jgi:glycosyltransferase involved in cell wall biosynthesis